MTPKEIQVLNQAYKSAGIDASKITPSNPFEKSGGTASLLQAAVAQVDPAQAAKWRVAAGGGLSIATLSELESGQQLSQQAQKDLWEHDAVFVLDYQKQQQESEASMFKQLEEQAAAASSLRNKMRETGGNESKAREALAREEAADTARKEQQLASAEHARQMNQRLEQQRQQAAQAAGVFING